MSLLHSLLIVTYSLLPYTNYGEATSPSGDEWQSPELLSYNKLMPRADFSTFSSYENALKVLPENSEWQLSLDGKWKFHWAPDPSSRPEDFHDEGYDVSKWDDIHVPGNWNVEGLQKDGSQRYGTPIYVNQKVIFQHEYAVDDWKKGVMRTPPETWTTYKTRNEVGSYRREFKIPRSWDEREVFLQFDGVDSFFYLWINGQYVGFSKNSRNAARFDITKYLQKGTNSIAVEVYRNSDGSFLEAQDMFRLPGIFRSVSLYSTPKVHIWDLATCSEIDNGNGFINISSVIDNETPEDISGYSIRYALHSLPLYSDDASRDPVATEITDTFSIAPHSYTGAKSRIELKEVKPWSAESPWRYVLTATLLDKKGQKIETVSSYIGFRNIEIRDTPAEEDEFGLQGRYFYVNGQPVKTKGVNRHETDPSKGHSISHERMTEEVMLMKRANINHVRCSHYNDDPYWYYLADKYGLYLEDEANLESHEYYYGEASLSHPKEWEDAHVMRNVEMVMSHINHPSIIIWSMGNEAGPGDNFRTTRYYIGMLDPSRPVQYERNNDFADIGSNQYPSITWTIAAATGKLDIKYPFHISEYGHSMGNSLGNLKDYWDAIESSNFLIGGAIWDWVDQGLYNHTKDGIRYIGYGGDFGDFPNDHQFVMNGIMLSDLTPKPQYFEVKKVYQNVAVTPVDMKKGKVEIFNKNYFSSLGDYNLQMTLLHEGDTVVSRHVEFDLDSIGPRQKTVVTLPISDIEFIPTDEYFANLEFQLRRDMPWAEAGYPQMAEQLAFPTKKNARSFDSVGPCKIIKDTNEEIIIAGDGFEASFSKKTGLISNIVINQQDTTLNGTKVSAFRAPVSNDNWGETSWRRLGLDSIMSHVESFDIIPPGSLLHGYRIRSTARWQAPGRTFNILAETEWTISKTGEINCRCEFHASDPARELPRIGLQFDFQPSFDNFEYYGRGPQENYADRKTGSFIGKYSSKVSEQFVNYAWPQNMANHEEVRLVSLTNDEGEGLCITEDYRPFSATALPWTERELDKAQHPYELPASDKIVLHIDASMTGLGGNSCGQGGPLDRDIAKANHTRLAFTISPIGAETFSLRESTEAESLRP